MTLTMTLAIDITDGLSLSNKLGCELLSKKSRVLLYLSFTQYGVQFKKVCHMDCEAYKRKCYSKNLLKTTLYILLIDNTNCMQCAY